MIIGSVALGFGAMAATERLLFGRRPKQRIAGWLKVVLGIGAVVGIAVAVWDGMESAGSLLGRADSALYEAKRRGRNMSVVV